MYKALLGFCGFTALILAACGGARAGFQGLENGIILGHSEGLVGVHRACFEYAVAGDSTEEDVTKAQSSFRGLAEGQCNRADAVAVCVTDQAVEGVNVSMSAIVYSQEAREQIQCKGSWISKPGT